MGASGGSFEGGVLVKGQKGESSRPQILHGGPQAPCGGQGCFKAFLRRFEAWKGYQNLVPGAQLAKAPGKMRVSPPWASQDDESSAGQPVMGLGCLFPSCLTWYNL